MMEEKEGRKPPCGEKVVRVLTWGGQEGRWWTRESGGRGGWGRGGGGDTDGVGARTTAFSTRERWKLRASGNAARTRTESLHFILFKMNGKGLVSHENCLYQVK